MSFTNRVMRVGISYGGRLTFRDVDDAQDSGNEREVDEMEVFGRIRVDDEDEGKDST